jgi:predicted nucleotidyltransferase
MAKLTLDELVTQLKAAFSADLSSVVLYGSAAGGDHNPKRSDQNVLVIVKQVPMSAAKAIAATARAWADAGNPPPMVFTEREWRASSDVFPMEYADILERNRVLHGAPPFDGISVRTEDLRLQLENEAMGKLLHLRRAFLANAADDKKLLEMMGGTASAVMVIFRAVCRLHGEVPAADNAQLVDQVARLAQLDGKPFQGAIMMARGSAPIPAAGALDAAARYVGGMEELVRHLDAYQS